MPKRISPHEANELMEREGYVYVDVRSEPEYEASHPAGAVNIPFMHRGPSGMVPNPSFVDAFRKAFPAGAKVVIGCQGGNRSLRAAEVLEREGWGEVVECRTGFGGAKDAQGRLVEQGWSDAGLPCEAGADPERCWDAMQRK